MDVRGAGVVGRSAWTAVGLVAVLALAVGCGGDDETSTSSSSTSEATSTTAETTTTAEQEDDAKDQGDEDPTQPADGTVCALIDLDEAAAALGVGGVEIDRNDELVLEPTSGGPNLSSCELVGNEYVDVNDYAVSPNLSLSFALVTSEADALDEIRNDRVGGGAVDVVVPGVSGAQVFTSDVDLGTVGVDGLLDGYTATVSLSAVPISEDEAVALLTSSVAALP
jgi:hypothetical protein